MEREHPYAMAVGSRNTPLTPPIHIRYWLACVDHPAIRTPLDFHLTFPASFNHVLANGALVKDEQGAGTRTAHWRQDFPCPTYLSMLDWWGQLKAPNVLPKTGEAKQR
jgi:hypothetical protein